MSLNWQREQQKVEYKGQSREGFTLTYIPHLKSLLLLGGTYDKTVEVNLYDIGTYFDKPVTKQWRVKKTSFHRGVGRKYHTAYYQQSIKAVIVYGGEADKIRSLQTFDLLFIDDWVWKRLSIRHSPPPRQYHSFIEIDQGRFLVFGGVTIPFGTYFNDTWLLKGLKQIRLKDFSTQELKGCSCEELKTKGAQPSGRCCHKAYFDGSNAYIIGGQAEIPQQKFTVFSLNILTLSWNRHSFNMKIPQLYHFSLLRNPFPNSQKQIMIFGGLTTLDKKNNRQIYLLNLSSPSKPVLRQIDEFQQNIAAQLLNHTVQLPFNQVCAMGCTFNKNLELELYRLQVKAVKESMSIDDYLRCVKNEQILSQQLIEKSQNLQLLYRQIQNYTSSLYQQYQEHSDHDPNIERQKRNQIQSCLKLKDDYLKIDQVYQSNLQLLKNARNELTEINEYFHGCMETERDEDD